MGWQEILMQFGIPVLTVILSTIIGMAKNSRVKKHASSIILITEMAKSYIIEAEKHSNYTGKEKKEYVLTRLLKFVFDNAIKNIKEDVLSDIIENEVALTNEVNVSKKNLSVNSMTIVTEPSEMPTSVQV